MKKSGFIRIDVDIHHAVKVKAAELYLSIGKITEDLLREWLEKQGSKNGTKQHG
jgi:hypothetical protein